MPAARIVPQLIAGFVVYLGLLVRRCDNIRRHPEQSTCFSFRCVNGGNDKVHMSAKVGPPLLEQHDDSNLPHCKILLVAQVFVIRYKNVKASGFGGIEEIAVWYRLQPSRADVLTVWPTRN